jgi:BolA protein
MHAGSATESHFNITAVSATFTDLNLVRRHQAVYKLLQNELAEGVHALAMHLYTEKEWEQRQGSSPTSPDCAGGIKYDKQSENKNASPGVKIIESRQFATDFNCK